MRKTIAVLTSSAAVSLGLALGPAANAVAAPSVHYGGDLHVVMPWVTIPDNFNPLNPGTNGSTAGGTGSAIYEPLMYANNYTGTITPMLATAYKWNASGTGLTLTIRSDVKWSNGSPFSASDVAFTFNYLKQYPALDTNSLWKTQGLTSAKATNATTVVLTFSHPNVVVLPYVLGQLIVPKSLWAKVTNPVTYTNPKPVGTGPFLLQSYSPTQVNYKKNPDYWMSGRPYIGGITMTAVKSNDTAELLLLNGDAAYTYDAITDPNATYVSASPSTNKYWWPVVALNFLYMNLTEPPFNDVHFRKAIAEALNDNVIAQRAYYGAIPPGNGPVETGVPNGQDAEWVPSSLSGLEWTYSPSAAQQTLTAAGYKDVNGSLENPQGQVLKTFNILIGSGWTDYISIAQTIGQELAPLGIHTTIDQQPYSTYASSEDGATYDMVVSWSNNTPSLSPYYPLNALLDSNPDTDWERYSNAADSAALASFASSPSLTAQKADMATIEKDILTNVPVIALTGRPDFFDYSTKYFTGWPSASDPYNSGEAPDAFSGGAEQLYLNVHLTK
ncbi:MAG TPA: ABC transporter substrate-binding protein [Acidimicrobiales bacterium]|nr:ABC transporter substrate-binding protein [Acidimicrobiales bacterium]